MTLTAAVACVGFLIGGLGLAGLAFSYHQRGYRPAWWLRLVLAGTAVVMLLIAAGYVAILAGWGERALIQAFWLRPLVALFSVTVPLIALYALRETAVHEDMLRTQDEFVQNVSHELRTPLAIILGFADLFRQDDFPDHLVRDYLHSIYRQAQVMNDLVRNVLYFYRNENVKGMDGRPVDLGLLVSVATAEIATAVAAPAGVRLGVDHLDRLTVKGDVLQLELAINNLLTNAIKFSPPAESGGTVRVTLLKVKNYALLEVADTGIGINPKFMPHLFKPFRQETGDARRPFRGVGLGLAVVKQIVTAHGGRIDVDSEVGKGTAVRVYLPLAGVSDSG